MLRRLYDWTLSLAEHPHALWALAIVAFVESSFFPIPPDILMIPMIIARPSRAWLIALVAMVASVLGGLFGYFIGAALFDTKYHYWQITLGHMRYGFAGMMRTLSITVLGTSGGAGLTSIFKMF